MIKKLSDLFVSPTDPMYYFIPELIFLNGMNEPVNLGESARLRRLQSPQKEQLRALLDPYIAVQRLGGITPWEFNQVQIAPGQVQLVPHNDPNEVNFWVVEYWREMPDNELELALELADPGLTPLLSVSCFTGRGASAIDKHAVINWLEMNYTTATVSLEPTDISGIVEIMNLITKFHTGLEKKTNHIYKAIQAFSSVKSISRRNPLYAIGLVAIIESLLLTNHQKSSLTHQFKVKLELMNNRFSKPMDLKKHFPNSSGLSFKKSIEKIYSYRSELAHGDSTTPSSSLSSLGDHDAVCSFLHELVRRLIVQAMREPELITDLKAC